MLDPTAVAILSGNEQFSVEYRRSERASDTSTSRAGASRRSWRTWRMAWPSRRHSRARGGLIGLPALMGQMVRTTGCNRVHPVEERCARWRIPRDAGRLTCRRRAGAVQQPGRAKRPNRDPEPCVGDPGKPQRQEQRNRRAEADERHDRQRTWNEQRAKRDGRWQATACAQPDELSAHGTGAGQHRHESSRPHGGVRAMCCSWPAWRAPTNGNQGHRQSPLKSGPVRRGARTSRPSVGRCRAAWPATSRSRPCARADPDGRSPSRSSCRRVCSRC
jgi:hypothetical protein